MLNKTPERLLRGEKRPKFLLASIASKYSNYSGVKWMQCPYCHHRTSFSPYVYAEPFRSQLEGSIVDANRFGGCWNTNCEAYYEKASPIYMGIKPIDDHGNPINGYSFMDAGPVQEYLINDQYSKYNRISNYKNKISNQQNRISNHYSTTSIITKTEGSNYYTSYSDELFPSQNRELSTFVIEPLSEGNNDYDTHDIKWLEGFKRKGKWKNGKIIPRKYSNYNIDVYTARIGNLLSRDSSLRNNFLIPNFYPTYSIEQIDQCLLDMNVYGGLKQAVRIGKDDYCFTQTIYYQVDLDNKIRVGRIVYYDKTGHRVQNKNFKTYSVTYTFTGKWRNGETDERIIGPEDFFHVDWTSTLWEQDMRWREENKGKEISFHSKHCLFGLQKLRNMICEKGAENIKVFVYEGDKNAVTMNLLYPQYVHLSVGSLDEFKADMFKDLVILKHLGLNSITAVPDKGYYTYRDSTDGWSEKAIRINNTLGLNIQVTDELEKMDCLKDGEDVADLALLDIRNNTHLTDRVIH